MNRKITHNKICNFILCGFFNCLFANLGIFAPEIQHILVAGGFGAVFPLGSVHNKYFIVNTWCTLTLLSLNHRHCRSDFVLLAGNVLYFQSISIYSTNLFCLNARIDFRILEISLFFKDTPKEKHIFLNVTKAEVSGFCALPNSSACSYRLAV